MYTNALNLDAFLLRYVKVVVGVTPEEGYRELHRESGAERRARRELPGVTPGAGYWESRRDGDTWSCTGSGVPGVTPRSGRQAPHRER